MKRMRRKKRRRRRMMMMNFKIMICFFLVGMMKLVMIIV